MGGLRVGSLSLALRLPDQARDRAPSVRETVEERFIPAVLDALRQELDARFGEDAVIRIRRLAIRLRIGPEVRDASGLARQVGQDLADHVGSIAEVAGSDGAEPSPDAEVRVWPSAGAWLGAALVAAARDRPGPDGRLETPDEVATRLPVAPPAAVRDALVHCAATGGLGQLLKALQPPLRRAILARAATLLPADVRAAFLALPDAAPDTADPASATAERPEPRGDLTPPRATGESGQRTPSGTEAGGADVTPRSSAPPQGARVAVREYGGPENAAAPVERTTLPHAPAGPPDGPVLPDPPADRRATSRRRLAAAPDPPVAPRLPRPARDACAEAIRYPTRWGGLVYLLNLALRLGMPEALWRIGVPEGAALSAMLATVTGDPDDPASAALAPEFPRRPAPLAPTPGWAREEFRAAVTEALAPPAARRAIAKRIEERRAAVAEDEGWRIADWSAAALVVALEERLDRRLTATALRALLAIEGELEIAADTQTLHLPLEAIDIDIRRAALDVDPGRLSWLDRRMVIRFGDGTEEWLP